MGLKEYLQVEEEDPIFPKIATGLAGGIGRSGTSVCGVFVGTVLAIGLKHGRDDSKDRKAIMSVYGKVQKVYDRWEKEFGSRDCKTITGFDLSGDGFKAWEAAGGRAKCTQLIAKAYEMAYEYL